MSTTTVTLTSTYPASSSIFLRPTKSRSTVFLLLPLLPVVRIPPLPAELWARIIAFALYRDDHDHRTAEDEKWRWSVQRVCKWWKIAALRNLYSSPHLGSFPAFTSFLSHLETSDAKWSPVHLSSHSVPGRYVRTLDLSHLPDYLTARQILVLNSGLVKLWPILPRLETAVLRSDWTLNRGVVRALADSCERLRVVKGVAWKPELAHGARMDDAIVHLLHICPNLEELEIHGPGAPADGVSFSQLDLSALVPVDLPHLHTLSLVGVFSSPFLTLLLTSRLPSLAHLSLTTYHSLSSDLSTPFLRTHGPKLASLSFVRGPEWPSLPLTPPENILSLCPSLSELTLLHPLPACLLAPSSPPPHPLRRINLPRPIVTSEYFSFIRTGVPLSDLPELAELRLTEFRWLKMLGRAGSTGARRGLVEVAYALRKKGVRLVDEACEAPW